jgi:hypothetical protein
VPTAIGIRLDGAGERPPQDVAVVNEYLTLKALRDAVIADGIPIDRLEEPKLIDNEDRKYLSLSSSSVRAARFAELTLTVASLRASLKGKRTSCDAKFNNWLNEFRYCHQHILRFWP